MGREYSGNNSARSPSGYLVARCINSGYNRTTAINSSTNLPPVVPPHKPVKTPSVTGRKNLIWDRTARCSCKICAPKGIKRAPEVVDDGEYQSAVYKTYKTTGFNTSHCASTLNHAVSGKEES